MWSLCSASFTCPVTELLNKNLSGDSDVVGEIPSGVGWPSASEPGPSLSWEEFSLANFEFPKHPLPAPSRAQRRITSENEFLPTKFLIVRGMGC